MPPPDARGTDSAHLRCTSRRRVASGATRVPARHASGRTAAMVRAPPGSIAGRICRQGKPPTVPAASTSPDHLPPLHDLRIVDLTDAAGAFATRLLADLGADVLRIEPRDGSGVRALAPFLGGAPHPEKGFRHLYHNAGKRSLAVDFGSAGDVHAVRACIHEADIVVESGAPGWLEPFGLDADTLRASLPHLVWVSISPFGLDGPRAAWRGADIVAAAAGGILGISGGADDPPMQGNAEPSYKMACLAAAAGALIAWHGVRRGSPGYHIDISAQEATMMMVLQTINAGCYTLKGEVPGRKGAQGPLQHCRDGGWVMARATPDRRARLIEWGTPRGYVQDPATIHQWGLEIMAAAAADRTVDEMMQLIDELDMVGLPVGRFDRMPREPHFIATRQFLEQANDALGATLGFVRSAFDGVAGVTPPARAPLLGEHAAQPWRTVRPARQAAAPATRPADGLPLAGIRVLDFTWVLAGPLSTRILASFGADVVRFESRSRPDGMRAANQPQGGIAPDANSLFNDANLGKRSVAVDLTTEEGRGLIRTLVPRVDLVVDNFRPGVLDRMGLGHAALSTLNPGVIVAHMPGCGTHGPWAKRATFGSVIAAASGMTELSGFPGRPPYGLACAFPDFTSPYVLVASVLAALAERERSGRGQEIVIDQLAATISLLGAEWMQHVADGHVERNANRSPNACPHGAYPVAGDDNWLALAVPAHDTDAWRRCADVLGIGHLAAHPDFATHAQRKRNEDALDAHVSAATRSRDGWALADALQSAGVAAAPVSRLDDMLLRDPQIAHRRHYRRVVQPAHPEMELVVDAEAIRLRGFDRDPVRAPMVGEHTHAVLAEWAGIDAATVDALIARGVLR
jgi:crotonobetainyl-CoA:carnitine CoA-transferase CaiB-like acyl-CoA transferase